MEENEITLNDMQANTGFTKRQIYNWQQNGIIPEPVRRERTGRLDGEIVYYPIEAYNRLRSIKFLPISSMTRKVGIDSLFLPLFLFGFRDEKIDEGIKRLFKKAIRYFRIQMQKDKDVEISKYLENPKDSNPLFNMPVNIMNPLILRFLGEPQKEIKKLLPKDTSNEVYDELSDTLTKAERVMEKTYGLDSYDGDLINDYIVAFRQLILKYPSLKEYNEMINRITTKDLDEMQASMLLIFGVFINLVIKPESLGDLCKKTSNIYGACLLILMNHVTYKHFKPGMSNEMKDGLLSFPQKAKEISESKEEVKPKRGRKKQS